MIGSLKFLTVLFTLLNLSAARLSVVDSYDPLFSNHEGFKRFQVQSITGGKSRGRGLLSDSRVNLRSVLKLFNPLRNVALVAVSGTLTYETARRLHLMTKLRNCLANLSQRFSRRTDRVLEQKITEMEGTIFELRNSLNQHLERTEELKKLVVALEHKLEESTMNSESVTELQTQKLASLDNSMEQLAEMLSMDRFSSLREMESALLSVEDRQERESAAARAGIDQLREEIPQQVEVQSQMMAKKLDKFKQDLRALVEKLSQRRRSKNRRDEQ